MPEAFAPDLPQCDILDDIEDILPEDDTKRIRPHKVTLRAKRNKKPKKEITGELNNEYEEVELPLNVPGTGKIFVKTWGCAHNSSDSEYMAGQLAAYGYVITENKEEANLWLLNSCTVKTPAEDHFRNEIEACRRVGRPIVVAGCIPQGAPRAGFLKGVSMIGVQQIDRVIEVVEETLKGNTVRLLGSKKVEGKKVGGASLELPKIRRNPLIEIIAISTGCLNQCTYCKTKHARGELGSYPPDEIVARAKQAFTEGVKEIWLTSEDTGAYGRDIGSSLPELLTSLCEVIPQGCMLRLGMTNPPYILEHLEAMAVILNHPRVYSFLHVPVQAASDSVLNDMKREYYIADFKKIVDFLKERIPRLYVATDIICGFPTETDEDFEETMKLCSEYKFPSLFINQFYPRPGTPAAKLPRLPTQVGKSRTKRLSDLFHTYEPFRDQIGEMQTVLVTEISTDGKFYVGHNKQYAQVLVPMEREFMGQMVKVKIVSAGKFWMVGEPISVEYAPKDVLSVLSSTVKTVLSPKFILPVLSCLVLLRVG
ncbi:hypothetical protein QYM36_000871, partial [Artemia franciscana]